MISSLSESSRASDVLRLIVELPLPSVTVRRRPLAVAAIVTQLVTHRDLRITSSSTEGS